MELVQEPYIQMLLRSTEQFIGSHALLAPPSIPWLSMKLHDTDERLEHAHDQRDFTCLSPP